MDDRENLTDSVFRSELDKAKQRPEAVSRVRDKVRDLKAEREAELQQLRELLDDNSSYFDNSRLQLAHDQAVNDVGDLNRWQTWAEDDLIEVEGQDGRKTFVDRIAKTIRRASSI